MATILVSKNVSAETLMAIRDEKLKVEWNNIGEGYNGDYNPLDPEDENLLRFDVYCKRTPDSEWEEVEDASYCTNVPAKTPEDELERLLRILFDRYSDVIDDYLDGTSVKKLGEELSWIGCEKKVGA